MVRWKIVNSVKAEELGIGKVATDADGFIIVDVAKIPSGLTAKNVIEFAEKEGIILRDSK